VAPARALDAAEEAEEATLEMELETEANEEETPELTEAAWLETLAAEDEALPAAPPPKMVVDP
jgi:hypothetical protein